MTTQNRPPPSYQEYAASMLANNDFRMMTLASRGLWYTLRLEYWCSNPLPDNPLKLARILGFDASEISLALNDLKGVVKTVDGMLVIQELADYRRYLEERRMKQSAGGKEGAERAKANRLAQTEVDPRVDQEVSRRSTKGSLVQPSSAQKSTEKRNTVIKEEDGWIEDFESSSRYGDHGRT